MFQCRIGVWNDARFESGYVQRSDLLSERIPISPGLKTMRNRLFSLLHMVRKLRCCSWAERWDLVVAVCTAGAVAGLLHTCSFGRVLRILDWWSRSQHSKTYLSSEEERRLLWAVEAVSRRLLPQRPCLTQALAAHVLLVRHGAHQVELQIGVKRPSDGTFRAHAWLERKGRVLVGGETSLSAYSRLMSYSVLADGKSQSLSRS